MASSFCVEKTWPIVDTIDAKIKEVLYEEFFNCSIEADYNRGMFDRFSTGYYGVRSNQPNHRHINDYFHSDNPDWSDNWA